MVAYSLTLPISRFYPCFFSTFSIRLFRVRSLAYPEAKMDEMAVFSADWEYINPIRSKLLEKYNQVFGA